MFKKIVSHPLFSGSFLMIGGSMGINFLSYVYHLVVGRLLGPVEYGVLASVFSVFYVVSILPLSSSVAMVKFISAAKNKKEVSKTYKGINDFVFKLASGLAIVMLIAAWPVSQFLHIPNIVSMMMLSPIVFFSLMTLVNQSASQGQLQFMGVVGPNFTSNAIKLILGVLFIVLGFSVPGAMVAILVGAVSAYFYSKFLISKKIIPFKGISKFDLKPFLKYALPVLLQAFAFTSLFTVDVILVKHFLPEFDAGLYASLSTSGKIIYFSVTPIAGVMFPIVARKHAVGEKYKKVFLLSLLATILISLGVDIVYYLFPEIAISVLFGSKYIGASGYLILMGVFMTFYAFDYFLVNYFLAIGKVKIAMLPIVAAFIQAILIFFFWHQNIAQVLNVSISVVFILFISLSSILAYEEIKREHV